MGSENISQMAVLFQQSGPFFASILFLIGISGWVSKSYRELTKEKEPDHQQIATYRAWLVFSILFGSALTLASTVWWFMHEPVYTVRGVVKNLRQTEAMWSDSDDSGVIYLRPIFLPADADGERRHDAFVIIRNAHFAPGETFTLQYQKTGGRAEELPFTYTGGPLNLRVEFDEKTGKNRLVPTNPPPQKQAWRFDLVPEAMAQSNTRVPVAQMSMTRIPQALKPTDIVNVLQADRVYVGSEITALNDAMRLQPRDRQALIESDGPREPMLITLLDLSRHEDRQLAYKASALLKGVDVNGMLRAKITDPNKDVRARNLPLLLRIDGQQALSIVKAIPKPPSDLIAIRKRLDPPWTPRLLAPSASGDGDRYWLTANVPIQNAAAELCVRRTFDKPDLQRAGGNPHASYSHVKKNVLAAADEIEKCGASVGFAKPKS